MNFEPQKFFIGLVGFFSILLPGALLAYLGKDWVAQNFLGRGTFPLEGAELWMVFLFVSYLLGHFAFLIGATLDDLLYNPLREATRAGQLRRLAAGHDLSHPTLRRIARSRRLFGGDPDSAVLLAQRLKTSALAPLGAASAINAYQWAKARLSKEHPEGLLAVERFEADSKFFRSFAVVLFALLLLALWQLRFGAALLCVLLAVPALWRYADQRFKGTQQAYWHIIVLDAAAAEQAAGSEAGGWAAKAARPDGLTHAGGVVVRGTGPGAQYLLVNARGRPDEWVLPKGHIEPYEDPREAAVREVHEEAGAWARVLQPLADIDLLVAGRPLFIRFYLMQSLAQEEGAEARLHEGRAQCWLPFREAVALATHDETRDLLAAADAARLGRTAP